MDNPTILVADGDPKNLQILRESLEASGFEVIVASDGLQAWQKISSDIPDLILSEVNLPKLDGFQLLEKLKADPVTSSIPLMFLTNRRELQDRVRSLRGGVKDYMIKPLHVKEVIARVRMILRRMERIREEEIESTRKLAGRLEEFSVIDLIENFGMERKTGILTLYNANNKSGEIYFRDGAVINASLANLKAEKAVYQMLPWKRGHFTMTFKEISVPDEIAVSNLGLLLQGFKRMEERERLFKMLPSPETTFFTTETFRNIIAKRELTTDVAKFISLIDGKRDILQIIDESNYDDIKTLERLVKLCQQGFIKPSKASLTGEEEISDMVSTIAEPKIIEKLNLGPNDEQRFVGRALEKETPPESRPTVPQAFRKPDISTYVPPERKPKESATPKIETQHEAPTTFRPFMPIAEPPAKKLPPPSPKRFAVSDDLPSDLEPFGEDAPPEEPSTDVKKPVEEAPADLKTPADRSPAAQTPLVEILDELVPPASNKISMPSPEMREILESLQTPRPPVAPPAKTPPPVAPQIIEPLPTLVEPATLVTPPPIAPQIIEPVQLRSETIVPPTPVVTPPPVVAPEVIEPVQMQIELTAPPPPEPVVTTTVAPTPIPMPSEPTALATAQLNDTITACLSQLLKSRTAAKPKLVIIGREGQHVSSMVRHLLGAESSLRRMQSTVFQYLEIGERKVESQPFEIVGISMEQQFTRLLDTAGSDLIGYIVMIEAHRKERIEYLSYLVNMLKNVYRRPLGIAIIKSVEQKNMSADTLRDLLNMAPMDFLQECAPTDRLSVTEFLKGFTSEENLQRWNAEGKKDNTV
jgi:CheY-like chemotaxis protein